MENSNHNWINNFADFDAVLVCKNELEHWEKDTTVRAFQTYQFRDSTVEGDDPEFIHIETGTVIKHDGDVLAIVYGEEWVDALPDLVLSLSALGWKSAEVYHPPETMAMLLKDLGRAIPAHINFDVVPANTAKKVTDYPEGASLFAHGKPFSPKADDAQTIAQEFNDMTPSYENVFLRPEGPITLLDDDDSHLLDDFVRVASLSTTRTPKSDDSIVEEPLVFKIPDAEPDARHIAPPEHAAPPVLSESFAAKESIIRRQSAVKPNTTSAPHVITIGQSILLFDTPTTLLSQVEIETLLVKHSISGPAIHLHPGAAEHPLRWDVLGEINRDGPWFAETMAQSMRLNSQASLVLVSILLLATKHSKRQASLRDLLLMLLMDSNEISQSLKDISSTAFSVYQLADTSGALTRTMDAIIETLGLVALIPEGQFFLDMPSQPEQQQVFRMRDLLTSDQANAYVVHVDRQDSHFIAWSCTFMRDIALKLVELH